MTEKKPPLKMDDNIDELKNTYIKIGMADQALKQLRSDAKTMEELLLKELESRY